MRRLATGWLKAVGGGRSDETDPGRAGALLALAWPDRVAAARGRPGAFTMENGRGASLEAHDRLAREPFLVIAEISGTAGSARILLAAAIDRAEIDSLPGLVTATETVFDDESLSLRTRRVTRYRRLVLSQAPAQADLGTNAAVVLAEGIARSGIDRLPWSKASLQWRDRIAFLRTAEGDEWPDLGNEALATSAREWLAPILEGIRSVAALDPGALDGALRGRLDWSMRQRLDQEAPTHFEAPTGTRVPIDYEAEGGPTIAIRVQELFGLKTHPTIGGGRVPLTLELLSPAHRPVQVTRDLPGFWRGSWQAVKTEMKGRYPRHPWPDDPSAAMPTTRAKPRGT
jgi:ATP-dependent helicase HrpB